jgi:hypothetical protein
MVSLASAFGPGQFVYRFPILPLFAFRMFLYPQIRTSQERIRKSPISFVGRSKEGNRNSLQAFIFALREEFSAH